MKLIPKSALVAEIDRRLEELYSILPDASKVENGTITVSEACNIGKYTELESFRKYIDTLEVKELDFDAEWKRYFEHRGEMATVNIKHLAKHFFELGMAVSNPLTVKDIKKIYHLVNEVSDDLGVRAMYVNIYQEALKRFKALKGE